MTILASTWFFKYGWRLRPFSELQLPANGGELLPYFFELVLFCVILLLRTRLTGGQLLKCESRELSVELVLLLSQGLST